MNIKLIYVDSCTQLKQTPDGRFLVSKKHTGVRGYYISDTVTGNRVTVQKQAEIKPYIVAAYASGETERGSWQKAPSGEMIFVPAGKTMHEVYWGKVHS